MSNKKCLAFLVAAFAGASGLLVIMPAAWAASGELVLHAFDQQDSAYPFGGLVLEAAGNLYGTTNIGGGSSLNGAVFKLVRGTNGGWSRQVHCLQTVARRERSIGPYDPARL